MGQELARRVSEGVAKVLAGHVLLGTEYPYDMGVDDPVGFIDKVKKLNSKQKELITGGNAARLLGI